MKIFYKIIIFLALSIPQTALAETMLTVTGVNSAGTMETLELSEEDLFAFDQHEVRTANDYVDGTVTFKGPLMRDFFQGFEVDPAGTIKLIALNDYSTNIPVSEVLDYDVILALSVDGVRMTTRDKGPIWVIYPMSDHKELQDPSMNDRLVWQLARLEFQ